MEQLAAQPTQERQRNQEQQRSFDPSASVNMLRYDLETFGQVLPETRERVCDEELSFLVEGVDRAARTSFVLKCEEDELVYFDKGEWKPYMATLYTGLEVAEREAGNDLRRSFLARWAVDDIKHGYKMDSLQPGESHTWHSSYAHEEEAKHGKQFMNSCGLVSDRKMGFLYRASCLEDGSVLLESQTVDGSDPDAFDKAMEMAEQEPAADLDDVMLAYDGVMEEKHGGDFFAGRRKTEANENAWQIIQQERDLIDYHLMKLEHIASLGLPPSLQEETAKKHLYGVWAAFKKRLDGTAWRPEPDALEQQDNPQQPVVAGSSWDIESEVNYAFKDFAKRGKVMVGCGGAISVLAGEENIMGASVEDVFSSIFGSGSGLTALEKKVGKISRGECAIASCPTRPGEVKVGGCGVCIDRCQRIFDEGKDPSKMVIITKAAGRNTVKGTVQYIAPIAEKPTQSIRVKQGEKPALSTNNTQNNSYSKDAERQLQHA
jgi:hypothetical protein